jgi:hypothetical protein
LVAVLGLALAVCFAKADVARDASDFGDLLAQCRLSHEIATLQQADGAKAVEEALMAVIAWSEEAQALGYTSSDDVATFIVLAGVQCSYRLGFTPKHPANLADVVYTDEDAFIKKFNSDKLEARAVALKAEREKAKIDAAQLAIDRARYEANIKSGKWHAFKNGE